jgi:hypothetical protein
MATSPHRIARLDFTASVADVDLAFGVRPRLERLAWELMPAAIERVFDASGPADEHLRIGRLDLDLGTVGPDHLEEDAIAALQGALSEALGEALHSARYGPTDSARLIEPAAVRIEDFETYLVWGRLPSARGESGFDAGDRLRRLIAEQPDALAAMLRRVANDRRALERLVLQAGEAGFRRLLDLLAPDDAAVILTLMADTLLVHRERRLEIPSRLTGRALHRLLRISTLEFLLSDHGSQFNRRRFLAHLLRREAVALGIDYSALLPLLAAAAEAARARTGFRSSLPTVLRDLLAEIGPEAADPPAEPAPGDAEAAAIASARAGRFDALLELVGQRAPDRSALEALARRLPAPLFEGLVERMCPTDASRILAMLGAAHSGPGSSLPALLEGPAGDLGQGSGRDGDLGLSAALTAARSGDFGPLLRLVRAGADNPEAFVSLVAAVPEALFAGLVRQARGSGATAILGCLDALIALHRGSPLLMASDSKFAKLVHATGLRLALADRPGPFRPPIWLRRLVAELAKRSGGSAKALRRALAEAAAGQAGSAGDALIADLIAAEAWATDLSRLSDADRVLRSLEVDPEAAAGALRVLAGDSPRLLRLAARLDAREREALLKALDPGNVAALIEELRELERLHSTAPRLAIGGAAFAQLLWTIAVGYSSGNGGARLDRAALRRTLAEGIAGFGGLGPDEFDSFFRDEGATADPLPADDPKQAIEQYLRTGQPLAAGFALPALAAGDRAKLAATIRRLARAEPGRVPALIERLLAWLLPEEAIECLSPGAGALAARWADAAGAVDPSGWQAVVAAALEGKPPRFPVPAGGVGRRLDRIALLNHWLDHGTTAWWAPDGTAADALLADLPGLTFAELDRLFGGADPERAFARLWRAIRALPPDLQSRLLDRLVPWGSRAGSAPAAAFDRLEPRRRLLALTRAAAEALAGRAPVLAEPAEPVFEPSPPQPPVAAIPSRADFDSARLFAWLDGAHAGAAETEALLRRFACLADAGDPSLAAYLAAQRGRSRARARWASLLPPEALVRLVRLLLPSGAQPWLDSAALLAAAARHGAAFGSNPPDAERVWTVLLDLIAPPGAPTLAQGVAMLAERMADGDTRRAELLRDKALRLAEQGGHVAVAAAFRRARPKPVAAAPTPPRSGGSRKPVPAPDRASDNSRPAEPEGAIFIDNAGIVLLNPYLPTLFERLGLLTETDKGPRLVGLEATSRGVHLLQYIADGRCDRPEPVLVLNKLLCGLTPAQPIEASIEPSDFERATCDGLTAAVIANWPSIANSSPAALRETFLQRQGRLLRGDRGWKLHVQRKTLDVLVDQLPWSFAQLFHRWMAEPVQVTW